MTASQKHDGREIDRRLGRDTTAEPVWWQETTGGGRRKARWLGVFQRRLALTENSPGCLTIPSPECDRPASLSFNIRDEGASRLSLQASESSCAKLVFALPSVPGETGSVFLASVPANRDHPSHSSIPSTVQDQIWDRIKLRVPQGGVSLARKLAYLLQIPKELLLSSRGPLEWTKTPFPYQLDGIELLVSRQSLLLADDMGLGKTFQAIAAMRILIHEKRLEAALIVVPAGLVSQWRKELHLLAPELRVSTVQGPPGERAYQWTAPAHVFLVGYETLRGDFTQNPHSPPRRRHWDLVILDEAQKIKNREAEISQKCKSLPRQRAWALTGTPLENNPDDLASILEFTHPLAQNEQPARIIPGPRMLEIHKMLQLRRRKHDVLSELPPKTVSNVLLPLATRQRETYDRAEKEGILELKAKGESVHIENVLELILRLKQVCNFCPASGESSKLEDIKDKMLTLTAEGHRAIIFSQFTDENYGVEAIRKGLSSFRPLEFTGGLNAQQKDTVVRLFKGDPDRKALIVSLRAGGQGLNLQDASYVFHFDRWWNPAVEHQAEDRSHRLGQVLPVHVYKYTCENTIEERIEEILRRKQRLFDDLVDDVSIDLKATLTEEELYGLFGLVPPRLLDPHDSGTAAEK